MEFNAIVTGDRAISARFAEWPKDIHDSLLARIKKLTAEIYDRVVALAPERTGELRKEIISEVFDDPEYIKGHVTLERGLKQAAYIKAGALEYGVHKRVPMDAHRRTITEAFGRAISPTRILVSKHGRDVDLEERMYLRGGFAGMEAEVVAELTAAINETVKD